MLGSLILYLKGMRTTMFQLAGFYCMCCIDSPFCPTATGIIQGPVARPTEGLHGV